MTDNGPLFAAANNLPPYTVGELSQALKRTVESAFGLVRVRGEITQPKFASTGHLYLQLKDEGAVLEAVCWKGSVNRLGIRPEHGMDVICTGRLTTYAKSSRYQLVIETMELAGEGALLKLLEDRKRRLAAEGLFDAARKKELPHIPESIGVITSPSGAVIHDILHRLADRFPRHVMVWPVAVQGAGAAEQIAAAINGFNALEAEGDIKRPAVLIIARGGGSLEDLMPFNEEIVVRAIAASHIPVISAVGHETDNTLCDLVADWRSPTPTAAAEKAVPVRAELAARLREANFRLRQSVYQAQTRRQEGLTNLARSLAHPRRLMEAATQSLDERGERLHGVTYGFVRSQRLHLERDAAALKHPRAQLNEARHGLTLLEGRLAGSTSAAINQRRLRLTPLVLTAPRSAIKLKKQELVALAARGKSARIRLLDDAYDRFADLEERLDPRPLHNLIGDWKYTLNNKVRHLESISYHKVLERGYTVVRGPKGQIITKSSQIVRGQKISIEFADGRVEIKI